MKKVLTMIVCLVLCSTLAILIYAVGEARLEGQKSKLRLIELLSIEAREKPFWIVDSYQEARILCQEDPYLWRKATVDEVLEKTPYLMNHYFRDTTLVPTDRDAFVFIHAQDGVVVLEQWVVREESVTATVRCTSPYHSESIRSAGLFWPDMDNVLLSQYLNQLYPQREESFWVVESVMTSDSIDLATQKW